MTRDQLFERFLATKPGESNAANDAAQQSRFEAWLKGMLPPGETDVTKIPDNVIPAAPVSNPFSPTGVNQVQTLPPPSGNMATGTPLGDAVNQALMSGAVGAAVGGNTQQVQGSNQAGSFVSQGDQTSQQTSGQTGTTTNTTVGTGQQTNIGTGNVDTRGTTQTNTAGTTEQVGSNYGTSANTGTSVGTTQQDSTNTGFNNQNTTGTVNTNNQGTSNQISSGTTTQQGKTQGTTSGTSNQATTGTVAGTSAQQGTSTTGVVDTLGFGGLLQGAGSTALTNDAARNAFLHDVMATGGNQFKSQVDQAVRQSLSGPGMSGVGESAQGRAAGYAAEQVARQNLNQRLNAAEQLAGPTALSTLVGAGNPYLGSTNTSNVTGQTGQTSQQNVLGTNTGVSTTLNDSVGQNNQTTTGQTTELGNTSQNQNVSGTSGGTTSGTGKTAQQNTNIGTTSENTNQLGKTAQSQIGQSTQNQQNASENTSSSVNTQQSIQDMIQNGFANLVNSETNKGQTNASSTAIAAGNTPMQQVNGGGGGGCYVSSVMSVQGFIGPRSIRAAVRYKLYTRKEQLMPTGYSLCGPMIAEWCLKSRSFSRMLLPFVRSVLYEELRLAQRRKQFKVVPWICHEIFQTSTRSIGLFAKFFRISAKTRNLKIKTLLQNNQLYFKWPF